MGENVESRRELLTLDELTTRVGMSVRNIRFYTTKGLVPPPLRRGRSGLPPNGGAAGRLPNDRRPT